MKAAVYDRFGPPDVIRIREIDKPVPKDGEVLIKVAAVSLNPLDWRLMRGRPYLLRFVFGVTKPRQKRPGIDAAGRVEATGAGVTRLKAGDEVFGACRQACAEYAITTEETLANKPAAISSEQAACAYVAGLTALQALRDKARIQHGQSVLINGAAGGVGTFAVQIARWLGAEVTGVCSTGNVELVRSLGASHVIDYTREDFVRGAARYDAILDCITNHTLREVGGVLKPTGVCVIIGAPHEVTLTGLASTLLQAFLLSLLKWRRFVVFVAKKSKDDLALLGELMADGKLAPVIDRRYRLDGVAEALRYLEKGHARGKVVVTI